MSQKIQLALTVCITIITGMLLFSALRPQAPILQEITIKQPEEKSITVSGTGDLELEINKAEFMIIIENEEEELNDAKMKTEETYLKAMRILGNHLVEKKDIITNELQISLERSFTLDRKVIGYTAIRAVEVTVRDLSGLEPLFTDLQEAQVGRIEDILFTVEDVDSYYDQVLQLAIKAAENKARNLAASINLEIGQPISIQETSNRSDPRFFYEEFDNYTSHTNYYGYSGAQSISVNQLTLTANVTITFELK